MLLIFAPVFCPFYPTGVDGGFGIAHDQLLFDSVARRVQRSQARRLAKSDVELTAFTAWAHLERLEIQERLSEALITTGLGILRSLGLNATTNDDHRRSRANDEN